MNLRACDVDVGKKACARLARSRGLKVVGESPPVQEQRRRTDPKVGHYKNDGSCIEC